MLLCPVCSEPLTLIGATCSCPRHHTFDVAREGYINLLVGGARGMAGDTKEMLRARRAFLEHGFYAPLSEHVDTIALNYLTSHSSPYVGRGTAHHDEAMAAEQPVALDAGCGEGYYLGRLREALEVRFGAGAFSCVGVDIAKEAARLAAKRYPAIRFAVADVKRRIPLATGSVTLSLNIFAPRNSAELARVVAPSGTLLVVIPGPHHLAELRERYGLLGIEPEKERHIAAQLAREFAQTESSPLEYMMDLSGEDVRQLLRMTPNARHRERQGWEEAAHEAARVTASFLVLGFQRAWSPHEEA